jgi:hypothetical protein
MPFPDICPSSISYGSSPEVKRTVYHTQNTRQRFLRQKRDDVFEVSYQVDNNELSDFETFITTEIDNGALTFTGPYYDGAEHEGTCEIIDGTYSVSYIAQDVWSLSYSFEVKDRDLTDAQNLYELINVIAGEYAGPEEVFNVFDALSQLVNNNKLVA